MMVAADERRLPATASNRGEAATTSNADIVVIALGTNDAKSVNWPHLSSEFPADYKALIDIFKGMPSAPTVLVAIPPALPRTVLSAADRRDTAVLKSRSSDV